MIATIHADTPQTDPDIALECEHAIDAALRELDDHVVTAGWPPEAAFEAMSAAADNEAIAYLKACYDTLPRSARKSSSARMREGN